MKRTPRLPHSLLTSCLVACFLFAASLSGNGQRLIPAPAELGGTVQVDWKKITHIYSAEKKFQRDIAVFDSLLNNMGYPALENKEQKDHLIVLKEDKKLREEAYRIDVLPGAVVQISGQSSGVFYGLMSVLQMIHYGYSTPKSEAYSLQDAPAFAWRGMHLDVSRHFFPVDFIKKYLDLLALHKFNTFHWHLTDDQGWRIEIKKYPLLTQVGSKRHETMVDKHFEPYIGDGKPVEGFYTQEEVKEIVRYAADRHITVVPEIEMPGHAMAALSAYPQYSCSRSPMDVMTKWGVSEDVFCTKDSSLTFVKDILSEVIKLFPSKYIHIGGDEVPKTRWKNCATCQDIMKKNKLADEHELQSYFIKKIDAYVTSKGRSIIGWDEILEGGLAPNAAVMSWRGEEGGMEAARQQHAVVMSPGSHCYFDHYQGHQQTEPLAIGGFTPIDKVYAYNPVPEKLNPAEAAFILGAQANVWTEYMGSPEHVEYMVVPRLCALSEVLWTGNARPGFESFKKRLRGHFTLLDKIPVYYARSIFDVSAKQQAANGLLFVQLQSNYSDGKIYYTKDGQSPDAGSLTYQAGDSIVLDESATLKAQYFENGDPMGHEWKQDYQVHKALGKGISSTEEPSPYYQVGGLAKLLDGVAGHSPRINAEWLGWSGKDLTVLIDLGEEQLLNSVSLSTLREENSWIYLPQHIEVKVGTSMDNFMEAKNMSAMEIESAYRENLPLDLRFDSMILGRYVQISLRCAPPIANGKPGAGEAAWLFLSEIAVD